jgi:hypothetical protein
VLAQKHEQLRQCFQSAIGSNNSPTMPFSPQRKQRTFDAGVRVDCVVLEIDRSDRTVVLARGVDRRRIGEAAFAASAGAYIDSSLRGAEPLRRPSCPTRGRVVDRRTFVRRVE